MIKIHSKTALNVFTLTQDRTTVCNVKGIPSNSERHLFLALQSHDSENRQ